MLRPTRGSLGCRTTPLEHWSKRKPTVEPRWANSATGWYRINATAKTSNLFAVQDKVTFTQEHVKTMLCQNVHAKDAIILDISKQYIMQ